MRICSRAFMNSSGEICHFSAVAMTCLKEQIKVNSFTSSRHYLKPHNVSFPSSFIQDITSLGAQTFLCSVLVQCLAH